MFRSLGKSKIAVVLAILFGISLFFFRGSKRYSNFFNSDNVIASVSGTDISTTKFSRTLQINLDKFSQMLGKKITSDEIIVLASDGLWDVLSNEFVIKFINERRQLYTLDEISKQLVKYAYNIGSMDNITIIICKYNNIYNYIL